eukprot:COSAG06_NODE_14994_length_1107_cov_14.618056_2_plen_106_part_01
MIILPRQARDKHRENSKQDAFLQGSSVPGNLLSIFFLHGSSSGADDGSSASSSEASAADDPHCGVGTTWRDRVDLGWHSPASWFFLALAVMCLVGTGFLCMIRPPS